MRARLYGVASHNPKKISAERANSDFRACDFVLTSSQWRLRSQELIVALAKNPSWKMIDVRTRGFPKQQKLRGESLVRSTALLRTPGVAVTSLLIGVRQICQIAALGDLDLFHCVVFDSSWLTSRCK